jgi:hypothetical protein
MTKAEFLEDPWKNSHGAYDGSIFNIRPAPEYASSEVIVASLYRAVGFDLSESEVPARGKDLQKSTRPARRSTGQSDDISIDTWSTVLHLVLESPKLPNQSSKRFLQLCPLIPDIAIYSGSARPQGNSWNPGAMVERMVRLGSLDRGQADGVWSSLFNHLSVSPQDDVWARWLDGEFRRRLGEAPTWTLKPLSAGPDMPYDEKSRIEFPARQFVRDLSAVLGAKGAMTRRQWTSLLEAILRLGSVTHTLWLCDVNDRIWGLVKDVLRGAHIPDQAALEAAIFPRDPSYLVYNNPSLPLIRTYASRYLLARLGLNLVLWHLEERDEQIQALSSAGEIASFLGQVERVRDALSASDFFAQLDTLQNDQAATLACKKGIGSNLAEFARHVLGQRQAASETLRGYDQGYFLRKKGTHSSAPWIVSLGPVALLALAHCCLEEIARPRSIDRLAVHLAKYGLAVDRDDIANGDLGHTLRMLGLVLDSPDAESGMLLVPPFAKDPSRGPQ